MALFQWVQVAEGEDRLFEEEGLEELTSMIPLVSHIRIEQVGPPSSPKKREPMKGVFLPPLWTQIILLEKRP